MEYFKILNFDREPFSNSPDPEVFFQSRQHVGCLQKLELSIRMRRGLNVVIGDIGTGKTTLCRQLIRTTADDEKIEPHLILDPNFSSDSEFLHTVASMFIGQKPEATESDWQLKELIKQYLFNRGVDEQKIVLLIIDEGQKIPEFCMEILREFLNYETNDFKLLQIVIFAQKEFSAKVQAHKNFADRINLYHILNPLSFQETRAMVRFRLDMASADGMGSALFSLPAYWVVYRATRGYPRKIINLCHRITLTMIIQNCNRAGFWLALSCVKRVFPAQVKRRRLVRTGALVAVLVLLLFLGLGPERFFSLALFQQNKQSLPLSSENVVVKEQLTDEKQVSVLFPVTTKSAVPATTNSPVDVTDEKQEIAVAIASPATEAQAAIYNPQPPALLGTVAASEQETLSRMIYLVYGPLSSFSEQHMEMLLRANPQIQDPDILQPGDIIQFPLMQVPGEVISLNRWRIKLAELNTLTDAYKAMLSYSHLDTKARLIPTQDRAGEVRFAIILREEFFDKESAGKALKMLPSEVEKGAKVIPGRKLGQSLFQLAGKREATEQ